MKLKSLLITAVIFLLPMFNYAEYQGKSALQAAKILSQTIEGRAYHPILKVPSHDNKQGKKNVYLNEYGVCVLVNKQALNDLLQEANKIAYPNKTVRPEITPHITLIQGVFKGDSIEKLINIIKKTALNIKATKITMADKFVKGGGNTFLDVEKGGDFFDKLTEILTKAVLPDAPMKQVIDDIKSGSADLTEMHDGGAWRDFNIPGSNRPHITVIYGKQDDKTINKVNKLLSDRQFSFTAAAMSIYQIDENGNLYGTPIFEANFQI